MSEKKYRQHILFDKSNFMIMGAGIGLMLLGFLAMIGGGYSDFNTPNYDVKYGFRTTVLAPMLVLAGLIVNGYAIMKKPSEERMQYVVNEVFTEKVEKSKARTESGKRLRKNAEPTREEVRARQAEKNKTTTAEQTISKKAQKLQDRKAKRDKKGKK